MNWNQSLPPQSPANTLSSPLQSTPTNDDIEAVIQSATSSSISSSDGWLSPARDTRTQIFVGNLPYRVRWQDVKDLFRKAGTVLRADVSLGPDNRSRGYGTVLYATADDAGRAVEMFNGYSWQTRILEVRPDRQPADLDSVLSAVAQAQPQLASSLAPAPPPPNLLSSLLSQSNPLHPALTGFPQSELQQALARGALHGDLERSNPYGHDLLPSNPPNSGYYSLFVGNLPFHCQWQDLKDLFRQAGTILRADVALSPEGRSRGFGTVAFATEVDAERAVRMFHGFEYNGRILKVHHDKLHQTAAQIAAGPGSPASANAFHPMISMGVNAPVSRTSGITLPSSAIPQPVHPPMHVGLRFDQNSSSSAPPVFERFQQQQRTSNPQTMATRPFHTSTSFDVDNVATLLASSHPFSSSSVSASASSSRSATASKAPEVPIPVATPTVGSTSSVDLTTSPSRPVQNETQKRRLSSAQHNPHHPGTIRIPPPPSLASFTHQFAPHGMAIVSPLHHPNMSSHDQAMQMQHPPGQITPHGLPPITPSMPPFILSYPLPSPIHPVDPESPLAFPHPQRSHEYSAQSSSMIVSTAPAPPTAASLSSSLTTSSAIPPPGAGPQLSAPLQSVSITASAAPATGAPAPPTKPRPGPGFIAVPTPQQHVQHAFLQQQFTRQHMGSFSPGLVMSPGTVWGRPGAAHPNPLINPAVGAPGRGEKEGDHQQHFSESHPEHLVQETLAPVPLIAVAGAPVPHSPAGLAPGADGHVRSRSSAGDDSAAECRRWVLLSL
ncbi:hypothetical protein AX16_004440 [Volvariella volvacea WC 439]|nr:hypothetical protein AX16_004440 [Volvariella volvacea WC 439]